MYRIGFIIDGETVSKQCQDVISLVRSEPGFEVGAFISQQLPSPQTGKIRQLRVMVAQRGLRGLATYLLLSRVFRWESRKIGAAASELSELPLDLGGAPQVVIRPNISRSGHVFRYSAEDVARIRELNLDALVRFGSGILKGDILTAARCGIISLHHGDNRINRGIPAGFWEVLRREPVTGFIVQQLTEDLDGGLVYFRGSIRTKPRFAHNLASLYRLSTEPFAQTLFRLVRGGAVSEEPHIYDRHLHRSPGFLDVLRYVRQRFISKLIAVKNRLVGRHDRWDVAYYHGRWRDAVLWRGTQLKAAPGTFIADPFAYERDGQKYVFVEEFNYRDSKGVISVYAVAGNRPDRRLGICLEEPTHLSYPFVFETAGQLYMVPETVGSRQVRLYRCHDFPLDWRLEAVLLDEVTAVDTNLVWHADRWWMLTSFEDELTFEHTRHIFIAEDLTGPWRQARCSPPAIDALTARNGGLLRDGDQLFRVSQHAKFSDYGSGVTIHRIDCLSDDEYRESAVQTIAPAFFPKISGTHHLHNSGNFLVYDFKRGVRSQHAKPTRKR